ncbi:conserved hypothetical protein [uncultured Thiomicrorhabdus sp.]
MTIEKLTKFLSSLVALWGMLIASVTGAIAYYHDCYECLTLYKVEVTILIITMASIFTVYAVLNRKFDGLAMVVDKGLSAVQSQQVKSEVDRLYIRLKDNESLTADEFKYLEHLNHQMKELGINSFTDRKISYLMSKDIDG